MNPFIIKLFKTSTKSYVKGFLIGSFMNRSPSLKNSNDYAKHYLKLNLAREFSEEILNKISLHKKIEGDRTKKTNYLLASFFAGIIVGPNKKTVATDDIFKREKYLNLKDRLKVGVGYASFNFIEKLVLK